MKTAIPWKTKMNQAGDYVSIEVQSFRRALKAKGTIIMKTFCDTFRKLLTTFAGRIDRNEFDELLAKKNLLRALMEFLTPTTDVRDAWVRSFSSTHTNIFWRVVLSLRCLPKVFIPKSSDVDHNGRIVRSPEALRPLTLCNCDCKILTTAICRGIHWYTMRCTHPSQRCISARQLTDNIFDIETAALAHVACALQE